MTLTKPYETYTSLYQLYWSDLYSGGPDDPIVNATVEAMDNLAYDSNGNKLPFSLEVSIFAQADVDRSKMFLEEKHKEKRLFDQMIGITVIVFYSMDAYMKYELTGKLD